MSDKNTEDKGLDAIANLIWFFFSPMILVWGWNWLGPDFVQNAHHINYGTAFAMVLVLKFAT